LGEAQQTIWRSQMRDENGVRRSAAEMEQSKTEGEAPSGANQSLLLRHLRQSRKIAIRRMRWEPSGSTEQSGDGTPQAVSKRGCKATPIPPSPPFDALRMVMAGLRLRKHNSIMKLPRSELRMIWLMLWFFAQYCYFIMPARINLVQFLKLTSQHWFILFRDRSCCHRIAHNYFL